MLWVLLHLCTARLVSAATGVLNTNNVISSDDGSLGSTILIHQFSPNPGLPTFNESMLDMLQFTDSQEFLAMSIDGILQLAEQYNQFIGGYWDFQLSLKEIRFCEMSP